ncbi:ribonuclease HII [Aeromicrobium terrae]|uniref:Ribonuclease HII n=1 Tax=Aeromicrobium terrae TaxID=2498846 RepID=A0A5C8NJZ5_9ACTN|nr:ribonuclease HII [Aeromicrobium terrae]TXL61141.1 ribonuclease HII [Aeromicrobium terrae]
MTSFASGTTVRRDAGLYGYERALERRGLVPVAGVDEAGRGACAGPLVAAAVVLDRPIAGLADSKLLTEKRREACYELICKRAVDMAVVVVEAPDCDRIGLHRANIAALRRALARLEVRPGYVLTDGFPVDGLGVPGLAVWKGDQVSASIAAASVVAKVTRDRIMTELHDRYPIYDFATHKGYVTERHDELLRDHGPCAEHRLSFVNVRAAMEGRHEH